MLNYKEKSKIVNQAIETYIYKPIRETQPVLYEIVKHALDGGKRLRSVITLTVSEALNPDIYFENIKILQFLSKVISYPVPHTFL